METKKGLLSVPKGEEAGLILFFPETFHPSISYLSHLLGFGFGLGWGVTYYFLRRDWFRSFVVTELNEDDDVASQLASVPLARFVNLNVGH